MTVTTAAVLPRTMSATTLGDGESYASFFDLDISGPSQARSRRTGGGAVMAKENKTKPTAVSVESYLGAIEDEGRQTDCRALAKLMAKATGEKPKMWGPSIVGFGSYHYKYDSGREGDSCLTGFASRKGEIA